MDVLAEYTEWQRPLSGVYSIAMEKNRPGLVRGGERGARPPPFTTSTTMSKVVVYTPAERSETLLLYPYMYSVDVLVKDLETRGQ
jgi:hypothetical protein